MVLSEFSNGPFLCSLGYHNFQYCSQPFSRITAPPHANISDNKYLLCSCEMRPRLQQPPELCSMVKCINNISVFTVKLVLWAETMPWNEMKWAERHKTGRNDLSILGWLVLVQRDQIIRHFRHWDINLAKLPWLEIWPFQYFL